MAFHKDLRGLDLHSPSNELVENTTGSSIAVLKVVKFTGMSSNGNPLIAAVSSLTDLARGVMSETVADNKIGNATTFGFLNEIDTSAFAVGTVLFSDSSGNLTATITDIRVGKVLKQDAATGTIYVDLAIKQAGVGESNTVSNIGTGGVGVFKQKVGIDFELKKINAGSTKITITDDTGDDEIDIDVTEANLTLDNIGGTLGISKGGTGQTTQTPAMDALAPTTTKGDIIVHNGTDNIRLAIGSNDETIIADSTEAVGFRWGPSTDIVDLRNSLISKLIIKQVTTSTVDIDADLLSIEDIVLEGVNLTVDITASGDNGLDTGSEASDTWYSIWVVTNDDGSSVSSLLSVSATTPTFPSGKTKKRRIGWIRNNPSSDIRDFIQHNRDYIYREKGSDIRVLSLGDAESFTDVDCSSHIPTTIRIALTTHRIINNNAAIKGSAIRENGNLTSGYSLSFSEPSSTSTNTTYITLDESQIFEYLLGGSDMLLNIEVLGWLDNDV